MKVIRNIPDTSAKVVHAEAAAYRCSVKKVFKILQNSQKNTWARVSFLMKVRAEACNFIKKRNSATGGFDQILRNF